MMNMTYTNGSGVFFTSDTHFGHANILKFCNRPYETVEEMNEKLIENWNSVVQPGDTVFHLGDFALNLPVENIAKILDRLNGKIHLIAGNHDGRILENRFLSARFESIEWQRQIVIENRQIILNHYPFLCYGGSLRSPEKAVWQLFGHVHTCPGIINGDSERVAKCKLVYQYDVGVDNNNWFPISFDVIKSKINGNNIS